MSSLQTHRGSRLLLLLALVALTGVCLVWNAGKLPRPVRAQFDAQQSHYIAGGDRLDVNRASAAELAELPGIGDVLAQRIVDDREQNGPFTCTDDLTRVPGIGARTLEAVRDRIGVDADDPGEPAKEP